MATTPFDHPPTELVWTFLQCMTHGPDVDEYFGLLSDDFTFWSILTQKELNKEALRSEVKAFKDYLQTTLTLIRCVQDGELVVIEAHADCVGTDGAHYESPLVYIVETDDGLITSVREYADSRLAAPVFGY